VRTEEAKALLSEAWSLDGSTNPEAYISLLAGVGEKEKAKRAMADSQSRDKRIPAEGYLALGDVGNAFKVIRARIENRDADLLDTLRTGRVWDEIRDDPRFSDMIALLDSMETHTEQYLNASGSEPQ